MQAITDTAITFDEALASLGVTQTTLTFEQKEHLDSQGYLVLSELLDAAWLNELRELFELLIEQEGQLAGHEVHQEKGARRLADLVNKSPACDGIYTHPQVLAAVYHVLGRAFKIFSLNGRDALPGYGLQGLHSDWGRRNAAEPYHLVNSIWLLDDFTPENGATRLVPGTHRLEGSPGDYLNDDKAPHPDEIKLYAPAGTVVVFNAHLWHGGTLNQSVNQMRRGLHCAFVAREFEQQLVQSKYIRPETLGRISPAAKYILDV